MTIWLLSLGVASMFFVLAMLGALRADTVAVATGCLRLAYVLLPWSAVQLAGIPIGDVPLAICAILLVPVVSTRKMHLPLPVVAGAMIVALSGIMTVIDPPSTGYVAGRYERSVQYLATLGVSMRSTSNGISLIKFELAIFALPLITCALAAARSLRGVELLKWWALGVSISDSIAIMDHIGITHVSFSLLHYADVSGRSAGLTPQPNFVGVQTAMILPVLLVGALLSRNRKTRLGYSFAIVIGIVALNVAGSRGSAVAALIALPLTLVIVPAVRRYAYGLGFALAAIAVGLFLSPLGSQVLTNLRLNNGSGSVAANVTASDIDRASVRHQGVQDFLTSPFHGIGWGFADDAHLIYLQVLAAGGLVAALGFFVFTFGTLAQGISRLHSGNTPARVAVASIATWLVLGAVENQLTDQWIYVPFAVLSGYLSTSRRPAGTAATKSTASRSAASRQIRPRGGVVTPSQLPGSLSPPG